MSLVLAGCAAAPIVASYALSGAVIGATAYQMHEVYRDGELSFQVANSDTKKTNYELIRKSSSLAIYPTQDSNDGKIVDIAREITSLRIASASSTKKWIKDQNIDLAALTREEKIEMLAKMGKSLNVDLTVLSESAGHKVDVKFFGATQADYIFDTMFVSAKTKKEVLAEQYIVRSDGLTVNNAEIIPLLATGIAKRFNEIRKGV